MRTAAARAVARVVATAAALSLVAMAEGAPPLPRADADAVGLQPQKLRDAHALLVGYVDEHKIAGAVADG
ncbi:MAG TPA: hypothetical protein VKE51_14555 [Vicinamibacterales bacterium]|nr:hypothetical protein [Vicinamibacterales bacterium]